MGAEREKLATIRNTGPGISSVDQWAMSYRTFKHQVSVLVLGLSIALPVETRGQITFDEPRPIAPNLVEVTRPFVADIDGNGALDVLLGSVGKGRMVAFEFVGDSLHRGRELIPGDLRRGLCKFGDVNGDGFTDIVTGREEEEPASSRPVLYLNDGQGSYGQPILMGQGSAYGWRVVLADLTGDGAAEIIHARSNDVMVWRYDNASGTMQLMVSFFASPEWRGMAAVDLNGDGTNELLLTKWYWVGYWDPTSGGSALVTIAEGTGLSSSFLPSDVNGDGRMDLLMYSGSGYGDFDSAPGMALLIQQVGGTFLATQSISFSETLLDPKVLDADADGLAEVWGAAPGGIVRCELTVDGQITSKDTVIIAPRNLDVFLVKDLDGDGDPDVLAKTMEDRLVLWEASPGPTYDQPPIVLYEWPHDLASSPAWLMNHPDAGFLCIASGTTMPYYGSPSSAVDFTALRTGGNGLDRTVQIPINQHQWPWNYGNRLVSADIDGDADLDAVGSHNTADGSTCILYAMEFDQLSGQFTERCIGQSLDQSLPTVISRVDLLDVDGDGYVDLLVKGYRTHPAQQPNPPWDEYFDAVLYRTDHWVFEEGVSSLPASYYRDHADLDGDGDEDLVVNDVNTEQLIVYRNLGAGQYEMSASAPFNAAFGSVVTNIDMDHNGFSEMILPAFADVDADGRTELLRCLRTVDDFRLYFQTITTDVISEPTLLFEQPLGVNEGTYAIPSDFDQNGAMDLLVVDRPSFYEYKWSVFSNNGEFPLVDEVELYHGGTLYEPFLHDEDGDGDHDLVMRLGPCLYRMKNNSVHPLISIGSSTAYPNPSTGAIIVDLGYNKEELLQVDLFDVSGRLVISTTRSTTVFLMDLRLLGKGVYTIRTSLKETGDLLGDARVVLVTNE